MFTELYLSLELQKNLPDIELSVLKYLFDGGNEPEKLPDHPFFKKVRWFLIGNCSSFYFVPMSTSHLYKADNGNYYLTTRFDLKDYDNEIREFLRWLYPYINERVLGHIGHIRYEEDVEPTLLYYPKMLELMLEDS